MVYKFVMPPEDKKPISMDVELWLLEEVDKAAKARAMTRTQYFKFAVMEQIKRDREKPIC